MRFSKLTTVLAAVSSTSALPIAIETRQFNGQILRGVNIGGWLVLEPWITPSIFQPYGGSVVDEFTLCANDPANAGSTLQSHWSSWATLADFQKIAGSGLNMVRIPVGYWAFQKYPGDTYIQGAAGFLDQAVGWARQTGLKVWIDLHGAPLSQNGFDNSGQRTATPQFTAADTITFMNGIISQVISRYASDADVVIGIELLNEPQMTALPAGRGGIENYYNQAYGNIRSQSQIPVIIQDGFAAPSSWNDFLTGQPSIAIDHHEYQVFSNSDVALSAADHVSAVYSRAATWGGSGVTKPLVAGEWTAAMTDCAPALNGFGIGARYDGTYSKRLADGSYDSSTFVGSCATKNFIDQWDQAMRDNTRNYIQAQLNAFSTDAQGWIFWNFKTEASAEWDYFRLLDNGVWPQ